MGTFPRRTWWRISRLQPDLLFFSGDQVYDHRRHYAAWLRFGRDFGEVIKDFPTVSIPDDHDVGQPNIWGHNGKKSTLPGLPTVDMPCPSSTSRKWSGLRPAICPIHSTPLPSSVVSEPITPTSTGGG